MALNWRKKQYFQLLIGEADEAHGALELLVDDLHKDKSRTVSIFLDHCGSEDFLWGLVKMLRNKNSRVAGNSAYILGTLAEHDVGQVRVLALINGQHPHTILMDLCNMLDHDDSESVMNAAGTLGTLAESTEGRIWMFKEDCIDSMIGKVMRLLSSDNMWIGSNAALVLARLSISEDGCQHLLHHHQSQELLTRLIQSLGVDEAGKGMNSAFAVGRICDTEEGRDQILQHKDISKMVSSLCDMLSSKDAGCGKNACFAISCLAGNQSGHALLLNHACCDIMLRRLAQQLHSSDIETSWFAAMTLRTLASQKKGCIMLRDHAVIVPTLQEIDIRYDISQDLHDEVQLTLELLKRLEKPNPPVLQAKGPRDLKVKWDMTTLTSGLDIIYKFYLDNMVLYKGFDTSFHATNLKPNTLYSLQLQVMTEGDESPLSDPLEVTTEECAPDVPEDVRVLAISISQIRIGWSPPAFVNGGLKGYVVYNGKQQVEVTTELCATISALTPSTKYDIYVCAFNHKGRGKKALLSTATSELGKHAPEKPILTVRGRNEIHVTWSPPEFPLGRLHKFEISLNGRVVYSGTDLCFTARRLVPNTDYTFKVIAVTSEGRCESEPAKKKTLKDEYNVPSTAPIFFSHPHKRDEQETAAKQTKQCQVQSKGSRIKTPLQHKQQNTMSNSCQLTESRPSTGVSSSESKCSSEEGRSDQTEDCKVIRSCTVNNNVSNKDSSVNSCENKISQYLVSSADKAISGESEDSTNDTELPQNQWKVVIRSKSDVKNFRKVCSPIENQAVSTSESITRTHVSIKDSKDLIYGEHNKMHKGVRYTRKPHEELGTKAQKKNRNTSHIAGGESIGFRSMLKPTMVSNIFDDTTSVRLQTSKDAKPMVRVDEIEQNSRKHHGKLKTLTANVQEQDVQKIPVASIKDGSPDSIYQREKQQTFTTKKYTEIKQRQFTDSDLELRKREKSRAFKGSMQTRKSSRLQSLISHENNNQICQQGLRSTARYSPMIMSRSDTSSTDVISDTKDNYDSNGFILSSNGAIIFAEDANPSSKDKHSSIEQPIKQTQTDESFKYMCNTVFKGKEPITKRTPNLFPWEKDASQFSESPYERYTALEMGNISKDIVNLHKAYSKPVNWNSIIDPLHDKHSSTDRSAFYQRAHTFMSSHRPLLKKTLEKLPSQGPGSYQGCINTAGTMEFPLQQSVSNNRYQFIPMQFRTQPLHMPGPPLHPAKTNANLYDKGAYLRKLEALSYLSTQRKQSGGGTLQPCGTPSMRYTHRESPTVQVDSPKPCSNSGLLTDIAH